MNYFEVFLIAGFAFLVGFWVGVFFGKGLFT